MKIYKLQNLAALFPPVLETVFLDPTGMRRRRVLDQKRPC